MDLRSWLLSRGWHSRRIPRIMLLALRSFMRERGSEAAASMSYYALFSLFPFFLTIIAAGSYFLEAEEVYARVAAAVARIIPVSYKLIDANLQRILELRGAFGAAGLAGLVFSATGVFSSLTYNVNRAWPTTKPRSYLGNRLTGLGIAALLAALLGLAVISTTIVNFLSHFELLQLLASNLSFLKPWWPRWLSWSLKTLIFLLLYLWAPNTRVALWPALSGAVFSATGWEIAAAVFTRYLTSGFVRYDLIYGSLGAIVVLMLWIYISGLIVLFGAHLSAAIAHSDHHEDARSRFE